MQLEGIDLDKNAIQRIESGQRFITDIELVAFAKVFNISVSGLYADCDDYNSKLVRQHMTLSEVSDQK